MLRIRPPQNPNLASWQEESAKHQKNVPWYIAALLYVLILFLWNVHEETFGGDPFRNDFFTILFTAMVLIAVLFRKRFGPWVFNCETWPEALVSWLGALLVLALFGAAVAFTPKCFFNVYNAHYASSQPIVIRRCPIKYVTYDGGRHGQGDLTYFMFDGHEERLHGVAKALQPLEHIKPKFQVIHYDLNLGLHRGLFQTYVLESWSITPEAVDPYSA